MAAASAAFPTLFVSPYTSTAVFKAFIALTIVTAKLLLDTAVNAPVPAAIIMSKVEAPVAYAEKPAQKAPIPALIAIKASSLILPATSILFTGLFSQYANMLALRKPFASVVAKVSALINRQLAKS
mgnify:CR=1 FL=1